ncbi:MAG: DUF2796 domain-containing protein, partial [Candidatus Thiodiazotropha sp.]|nr:DUF2796 domain-containing protein [Candidatus Thiodiazotropha sp. (ex Codakia orbicularis)]
MTKINPGAIVLSLSLLGGSVQIQAAESDHEHHEAHVHGEAELLIAIEGDALEIEFRSPAMNIVGFEHQPADKAQMEAVEAAIGTLKQAELVFGIPSGAKCEPVAIEVESPLAEHAEHAEHA